MVKALRDLLVEVLRAGAARSPAPARGKRATANRQLAVVQKMDMLVGGWERESVV